MNLRKDDPVYYKAKMKELIKDAKENGIGVEVENLFGLTHIFFKNNMECAGVVIVPK
jgi:hypothetical protein